jgi:large subunit ribosomal protein L4e
MAQKTAEIFDLQGKSTGKITLPSVFSTPLRPDVIKRAVLAIQSNRRQKQGRDPMAGKKTTAESRGTGSATARVPRMKSGAGRAAFAPSTVKGRQPHPPKVEKEGSQISFNFSHSSNWTKRNRDLKRPQNWHSSTIPISS